MASTTSDDEFDQLPDPFAGIDWNKVPGLSAVTPSQHNAEPRHSTPSHSQTNVSSDQYSYDEVDAAFLAEVDQVERRLLPLPVAGSGGASSLPAIRDRRTTHSDTGSKLSSRYFRTDGPAEGGPSSSQAGVNGRVRNTSPRAESGEDGNLPIPEAEVKLSKVVHRRSSPATREPTPKKHKGKQKESSREILEEVLNNLEDEMVCPICCDIFAHAHLGNPCGHTFCGECGWRWIQKNQGTPSCAICRANLSVDVPMIPNFSVDNAVEKHVHALRIGGMEGWEIDGSKFAEWQGRKARWKADFAKKMARRSATVNISLLRVQHTLGDASDADDAEEEAESSGAGSSDGSEVEGGREAGAVQQELARRVNNPHRHHRRPGGNRNRQHRASGERHDAGRSGSNPRGRRPRRRRRRD
ncbi:hypothetical protein EDB85DRAFT_1910738 [Lactarius pseudohatsudake]|nr:hypothetical protein EDB85DRAFT_1910738 [Lactarius pseudohatsudake]